MAGRAIAAVGVVLAFVCIWIDALPGDSYWSGDGTTGAFVLVLACLAALALAAGYAGRVGNDALLVVGAVMLGFYLFIPVAFAFDQLDIPDAGTWLALAAGLMIVTGAGITLLASGGLEVTPAGGSGPHSSRALGSPSSSRASSSTSPRTATATGRVQASATPSGSSCSSWRLPRLSPGQPGSER